VLVTVIEHSGHSPAETGAKIIISSSGSILGTVGGGSLENTAIQKAKEILVTKECTIVNFSFNDSNEIIGEEKLAMLCGGRAKLFFEYLGSDANIYIFGAGHIGRALTYHLKNMNFTVSVIDIRPSEISKIVNCKTIITENYEKFILENHFASQSFFVVATHSHELDYQVLKALYQSELQPKYIGAVASSQKAKTIKERLQKHSKDKLDFSVLHMPVGIKIGGNTPEFIAISIISELISIFFEKN
jgi:xanthine dehydrogenase accessory factor